VLAATKIKLTWNAGTNARSYNLKRSLSAAGPYDTIAARTTKFEYPDEHLTPATTYYYVVTSLNSAGESDTSRVLALRTKDLVAPTVVLNPHVASGDATLAVTWDFQYDAVYDVFRSNAENGMYDTIATNVDAIRYEDKTTVNGTTYYYKVVAHNGAGRSPETPVLSGKPVAGRQLYISFNESTGVFAEDTWGGYHGTLAAAAARDTGITSARHGKRHARFGSRGRSSRVVASSLAGARSAMACVNGKMKLARYSRLTKTGTSKQRSCVSPNARIPCTCL
jgi:hypothetical protein